MSRAGSQEQTFLRLLSALKPHWHGETALPARIQRLLAQNRAFGARDRRLYRELIYTTLRFLPWLETLLAADPATGVKIIAWLAADLPSTRAFRSEIVSDLPPCPSSVAEKAAVLATITVPGSFPTPLPPWFHEHCPEIFAPREVDAMLARAPLWLRLQTPDPSPVFSEFHSRGWSWQIPSVLPSACELREADITRTEAYRGGLVEIQDLGSQMVLASIGIDPSARWLDACAGAGGKSLQLARMLGPAGHIDAYDVRREALAELHTRALRAAQAAVGTSATLRIVDKPAASYDGVLVDAPCSGSGTWRRAPHLKWIVTPAQIDAASRQQRALLHQFSHRVRPGGRLVYATCSLSRLENEAMIEAFLADHLEFQAAPFASTFGFALKGSGFTIFPARHNTDGFFVASLRRTG